MLLTDDRWQRSGANPWDDSWPPQLIVLLLSPPLSQPRRSVTGLSAHVPAQRAGAQRLHAFARPGPGDLRSAGPLTLWCPLSSTANTTGTFSTLTSVKLIRWWIVQRRGRDLKTSVIKLWCAGWIPHCRLFVRGCPCLRSGVDHVIGHVVSSGVPLAVALPSLLHDW